MKTFGRILLILLVTILIGAGIYALVDANASSSAPGGFPRGDEFRPGDSLPDFDGDRPDGRERGEMEGGWVFGLIKNVGVIAIFVVIIVLPPSINKKKRIANANPERRI